MEWDRYDLFLGAIRVGLVYQSQSYAPAGWGHIVLDRALSDPETPEAMRLARFIALSRESARLFDLMDEHGSLPERESVDAELAEVGPAFLESENWCLVKVLKHRVPIPCPDFGYDDEIAWVWETGAE